MDYSQEELNQILLSKPLNAFYLAIIEHRGELLTDEEFAKITRRNDNVYTGVSKEEIDGFFKNLQDNEMLKDLVPELMKMYYSLGQIRQTTILTIIGDKVYNIGNAEFVDLKRFKIIHFDNFTNYYDETNAKIRIFTPEEEPQIKQPTALVDVDDESIVSAYEIAHINQEKSEDLTSNFFAEVKGKPYTLSRKPYNN